VQNLYFAYLFVLRAVMKAAPVLTTYQYDTGLAQEDQQTQQLITQLVSSHCADTQRSQALQQGAFCIDVQLLTRVSSEYQLLSELDGCS
jgi:hypothetical protein